LFVGLRKQFQHREIGIADQVQGDGKCRLRLAASSAQPSDGRIEPAIVKFKQAPLDIEMPPRSLLIDRTRIGEYLERPIAKDEARNHGRPSSRQR
jgi:hypothetical protein